MTASTVAPPPLPASRPAERRRTAYAVVSIGVEL